jgi:hypothetical protein
MYGEIYFRAPRVATGEGLDTVQKTTTLLEFIVMPRLYREVAGQTRDRYDQSPEGEGYLQFLVSVYRIRA